MPLSPHKLLIHCFSGLQYCQNGVGCGGWEDVRRDQPAEGEDERDVDLEKHGERVNKTLLDSM